VEVRDEGVDDGEGESGDDDTVGLAGAGGDLASLTGRGLEGPHRGGPDGDDPAAVRDAVHRFAPDAGVEATATHDWVADPYAKGTWLAIPPGWTSDGTFAALTDPEPGLAFAGSDIASEGAGWIEGAISSAHAAAAHVLGALRAAG